MNSPKSGQVYTDFIFICEISRFTLLLGSLILACWPVFLDLSLLLLTSFCLGSRQPLRRLLKDRKKMEDVFMFYKHPPDKEKPFSWVIGECLNFLGYGFLYPFPLPFQWLDLLKWNFPTFIASLLMWSGFAPPLGKKL